MTVPKSGQKVFGLEQSAKMAGISEEMLILWISTGRFTPSIELKGVIPGQSNSPFGYHRFSCTEQDIKKLRRLAEETAQVSKSEHRPARKSIHVKGTLYTVQELAAEWGFGVDKIRELFEKEPGVVKLAKPKKPGRRAYVTLRIPEDVAARVQRRNS